MAKEEASTSKQTEQPANGGELVPWDEAELAGVAAIEPTPELVSQAYAAVIEKTLPPEVGDPAISARMILERIKSGTLDESMSPAAKLPGWRDLFLDRVVVVYGFHMNKSTYEIQEGEYKGLKGVYAVCEVAPLAPVAGIDAGTMTTVQTGGQNVLMQLVKAWEERRFPFKAVLVAVGTGQPGRETLWLRTPEGV
ncbi:MAG TPA: hypothetical protein VF170_14830 [Planctomycetaceae bacterium]